MNHDSQYKIGIMQKHLHGKTIEQKAKKSGTRWIAVAEPSWNWTKYDYREKPTIVDTLGEALKDIPYFVTSVTTIEGSNGKIYPRLTVGFTNRIRKLPYDESSRHGMIIIPLTAELTAALAVIDPIPLKEAIKAVTEGTSYE